MPIFFGSGMRAQPAAAVTIIAAADACIRVPLHRQIYEARPGPGNPAATGYLPPVQLTPASIGSMKAMILALDAGAATRFVGDLLSLNGGSSSLRGKLSAYAEAHGVPV
jgi:hypothetical protein